MAPQQVDAETTTTAQNERLCADSSPNFELPDDWPAQIDARQQHDNSNSRSKKSHFITSHHNQHNLICANSSPLDRLLVFLLPLIFALLLPNPRLIIVQPDGGGGGEHLVVGRTTTSDLLLALIKLPFDRIKLESGVGLVHGAMQKADSSKSDLQEEETHMLLVAPAEHRASYVPSAIASAPYQSYANEHDVHLHGATATLQGGEYGAANSDGGVIEHTAAGGDTGSGSTTEGVASSTGAQASALQARADLPAVRALNVKCEKNHMTVNVVFDRPFYGMVFSKGHYNDQKCVHLAPNSGQTSVNFDIHLGKCGMSSSDATPPSIGSGGGALETRQTTSGQQQQPNGVYIENTIIIQYDPLVQEIYDQARKLRCTWYDYYEKSVTFRPYNVDMLDAVTANFLGDNIQCWMQIQVGKGPWSSEVAGIVKIGQTMTMVLAIKDDENRFDMLVRNCVAHDGKHQPIQLVDEFGCVARPKIMGKFQKVRNFGTSATVVSYAHFQAFKFPDSMSVHFQCVIQVCRYECPEPACSVGQAGGELSATPQSSGGGNTVTTSAQDYAASGTEMIASKEALPLPASNFAFAPTAPTSSSNGTHSNVHLKLDESQGRVQVKLDTSMMAALNNGRPPATAAAARHHSASGGPLPPHLLHMAGSAPISEHATTTTTTSGGRTYLSSSYYKPVVVSPPPPPAARQQATSARQQAPSIQLVTTQTAQLAPPVSSSQQQLVHYSPQYPARRSSSALFASRLGDVSPSNESPLEAPYEAEYQPALSLIGSPRGLRIGAGLPVLFGGEARRVKRDTLANHQNASQHNNLTLQSSNNNNNKQATQRKARHLSLRPEDSTAVATHKTIQVVSPDDVAFNLLNDDEDTDDTSRDVSMFSDTRALRRLKKLHPPHGTAPTSVCFSTTRFLWGALVTLATLASSVVLATYVILKQRAQLERKLSTVYVDGGGGASSPSLPSPQTPSSSIYSSGGDDTNPIQRTSSNNNNNNNYNYCVGVDQRQAAALSLRRQHEEMRQRNNYLTKFYSQFAPSTAYWTRS